jgi:signal peptidase I
MLRQQGRSGIRSLVELVLIVAAALAFALLIQAFLVKPYRIPSESMEPTLDVGERVLVSRVNYHLSSPDRGDIVVFHPPAGADGNECGVSHPPDQPCPRPTPQRSSVNFIKRIVAVPGDTLSIQNGHAVVNGKVQKESFTRPCAGADQCSYPRPIKVPPGHFFMMGDNRGASDDSRFWGPVPRKWIIGQAFFTYWPPKRIGIP